MKFNPSRLLILLCSLALTTPTASRAVEENKANLKVPMERQRDPDTQEDVWVVGLGNDLIGLKKSDRWLTSNIMIGTTTKKIPTFIEKILADNPNAVFSIAVSQYLYTPDDTSRSDVVENDRPYAGWLFVTLQGIDRKDNYMIVTGFDVGVVGPLAGGETVQSFIHKATGSDAPKGWDNQLHNEVGINVFKLWAKSLRSSDGTFDRELIGHVGLTLGNVNTHAETGFLARWGYNVPDDMGAPFLSTGEMATAPRRNTIGLAAHDKGDFSFYVFGGADARAVARDMMLDGNTFGDSHSVDSKAFVYDWKVGVVVGYKGFEVGYTNVRVSKRFEGQVDPSDNGVIFFRYTKRFK
jgi:hypothetical protein